MSLKRRAKEMVRRLVAIDPVWRILTRYVMPPFRYVESQRQVIEKEERKRARRRLVEAAVRKRFPEMVVRHGPFEGMQYTEAAAYGSELFPKLLGSYESELHEVVEEICATPFEQIINVGAAEGYYAIGLALRIPAAKIVAVDIDAESRRMCREMAGLNGVDDRVRVETGWRIDSLTAGPDVRTLLLYDCEGCESELLKSDVAALRDVDLLIEVHDFVERTLSIRLMMEFESSHSIRPIFSMRDEVKAETIQAEELDGFEDDLKRTLVGELRPETMVWLYMVSRTSR